MPRLFLNCDLSFKKVPGFSCVYNGATGWFFPGDERFWRFLNGFRTGGDPAILAKRYGIQELNALLPGLLSNKFLLQKAESEGTEYLSLYPTHTFYITHYKHAGGTDVALHRQDALGSAEFESHTLAGWSEVLWYLCDGKNTLDEILRELEQRFGGQVKPDEILGELKKWASIDWQIVKFLPRPLSAYSNPPTYLLAPAPIIPSIGERQQRAGDVQAYHLRGIRDARSQFERIESTLSHIYRAKHPILGWRSYGEALLHKIQDLKSLGRGMRFLEVGGGQGHISKEIMSAIRETRPEVYATMSYFILDLSPELIRHQRRLHDEAGVRSMHIQGEAQSLAVDDNSIDVAISNEVIADLPAPELDRDEMNEFASRYGIPLSKEFLESLKEAPKRFRLNLGAFRFLTEIRRVLKPGGLAIITEYGYADRLPSLARHLDHPEYSIHFGQMLKIAQALGLKAELSNAFDFLGFHEDVELISHHSYQAAMRLLERHGISLPNIAYTKELLGVQLGEKADSLKNMVFVKCERGPIEIVKILVCRKPVR